MRLSNVIKTVVLGNVHLIKFCEASKIDMNKLQQCDIERIDNELVFTLDKVDKPKSTQVLPLDIDIATQPDPVLVMIVNEKEVKFSTTNKTHRVFKEQS